MELKNSWKYKGNKIKNRLKNSSKNVQETPKTQINIGGGMSEKKQKGEFPCKNFER